jgi:RNA polymerase sigma-70 factor (ECF subfamily)
MERNKDTLVTRLKKGDKKAMEALFDTYSPTLFSITMRYAACREDAEDMLQESMINILNGIQRFQETFDGSFEAWMKRVTMNHCLGSLRKKIGKISVELPGNINDETFDSDDHDLSLSELDPGKVIELIQELPAGYRTVLNLYVFEQRPHKEIAQLLQISENTSKSQLSKARMLLKKKVTQTMIYQTQQQ